MKEFKIRTRSSLGTIQPVLVPVPKKDVYVNMFDYCIYLTYDGKTFERTIVKGFLLDGASIPRLFWTTTAPPFSPKLQRGAIIHDDGYQNNFWKLKRREWDEIAYNIWRLDHSGRYVTRKLDIGLKLGGWHAWNKYRKAERKSK